jgi:hypothetical protein
MGFQGVDVADRMEPRASNPEHWESVGAALYNEALLAGLDAGWDAPPPVTYEARDLVPAEELPDSAAVMAAAYPRPGPLVWKDPRACLLLPYWRGILPAPLTAIFIWRDPLEVARSLHTRDGMPIADGVALWERYNRSAAIGLQGVDTFVLDYADLLGDPEGTLGGIADWLRGLGRFGEDTDGWDPTAAADSVDGRLHRETAGDTEPDAFPPMPGPLVEWLTSQAGGHSPLDSSPPPPASPWPGAILETRREIARLRRSVEARDIESDRQASEHADVVAMLEALVRSRDARIHVLNSDLRGETMRYEGVRAELDRVLGSTSWKVTSPVRTVLAKLTNHSKPVG